jgi:VRR-NUC domain
MLEATAERTVAVESRRATRNEERREQIRLAELLRRYLDPARVFWSSLENRPVSAVSGMYQKLAGVRSGLPDLMVMYRNGAGLVVIFIELKSHRGVVSETQLKVREEMVPIGVQWLMVRSARAALAALHLSGVPFRRKWQPPQLKPWEGPFPDPTQRLPMHPKVMIERREAKRRYRLRRKLREREAARLAAQQRSDFPPSTRSHGAPRPRSGPGRSTTV